MKLIDGSLLWKLKAERGFPLDVALEMLSQNDFVPTWPELLYAAKRDGTDIERLCRDLQFFIREAYSADTAAAINSKLQILSRRYQ